MCPLSTSAPAQTDQSSPPNAPEETSRFFTFSRDLLDIDDRFETHLHQGDQLAWTASGSTDLDVEGERWHLRSDHMLWIPAGTLHRMTFSEPTDLLSVYINPLMRPEGEWDEPRTLRADQVLTAILLHLTEGVPGQRRRELCCRLILDVMPALEVVRDVVVLPRDPRARAVAVEVLERPAEPRELEAWASDLGVSAKTLARAFVRGTGLSFRQWRVNARLRIATRLLAEGLSVQDAAAGVGYASAGSFIVAFRRRYGTTPAQYASARGSSESFGADQVAVTPLPRWPRR